MTATGRSAPTVGSRGGGESAGAGGPAGAAAPVLVAEHLARAYETPAGTVEVLRDVSLSVVAGESVAILGPSGAGKSTLLHLLGGLEPPSSGRVRLAGVDPYALDEAALARLRNRQVGFVFQDHHLLAQYSALENVLLPTLAAGRPGDGERARARGLLERVGLGHRLEARPATLSGGERQRVALARALIMAPPLVLADEPTGSLDAANAAAIGELLVALPAEHGVALVVVTHSAGLAERCTRRVELVEGRL